VPRDPYKATELPEAAALERRTVYRGQKGIWIRDLNPEHFRFVPGGHRKLEKA